MIKILTVYTVGLCLAWAFGWYVMVPMMGGI